MMFPPFRLMSWVASGVLGSVYTSMQRSVKRGALAQFHVCTSPALATHGGHVYSDRGGGLTGCGLAAGECGRQVVLVATADRHLRSALWFALSLRCSFGSHLAVHRTLLCVAGSLWWLLVVQAAALAHHLSVCRIS